MPGCADVPTLEMPAAVDYLRGVFPDLKIRVVDVGDLMTLAAFERAVFHFLVDPGHRRTYVTPY